MSAVGPARREVAHILVGASPNSVPGDARSNTKDPNSDLLQTDIQRAKREPVCSSFQSIRRLREYFFWWWEMLRRQSQESVTELPPLTIVGSTRVI
jgi:hypothetical protein